MNHGGPHFCAVHCIATDTNMGMDRCCIANQKFIQI